MLRLGSKVLVIVLALEASAPASAQLYIMGRTSDRSDIVVSVNEPNGEIKVRDRAAKLGGSWQMIHKSDKCGWAAVYTASNLFAGGSTVRYFVADGASSPREAGERAKKDALTFRGSRTDLTVSSVRSAYQNRNAFDPSAPISTHLLERTIGVDRCTSDVGRRGSIGPRG